MKRYMGGISPKREDQVCGEARLPGDDGLDSQAHGSGGSHLDMTADENRGKE